ncbi:M56 family metallopeptidase [Amycolatopsis sp. NPDC024027]|uniref:M56 family metallopeptidase n=1 Tax=Amycolatopsis sp. NPDC024027 TaxID=3154327 RepID=UPI0033C597D6
MIYVLHHVAALVLAGLAAGYLRRARWTGLRPWLAVALWQAIALTIVVSAVSGLLALGLMPLRRGIVPGLLAFATTPPDPLRTLAITAGLALAAGLAGQQLWCAIRVARQRARHRNLLALLAEARDGALFLDHPLPVAYCVPGRTAEIVLSTGARALLTDGELAAVLAHEHTHLRERHDLALAPFTALARLFPRCHGVSADIHLLLEMRADDRAARRHGRDTVAAALEKFRAHGAAAAPPGTLGAAAATTYRIDRLRRPPTTGPRVLPAFVTATVLTVLATPLSLLLTPF